ncbi:MAG: HAD family hydrolase [Treponema sp.]|jgi:putative hydrolase of the HAD superfamily|nr:HAD family hydrolase [Treponema sp.]
MRCDIEGVAFDLDGTLYPNYRFYVRLLPFVLKEQRLLRAMGKARDRLRKILAEGGFYECQARIIADILKTDPASVHERLERLVYRGWEPIFREIKLYPHVKETLCALREGGFKLGILSDFPPELKLKNLGLGGLWDTVLCSEDVGRLKPDAAPFLALAETMGIKPERLLYVGNSVSYDIIGAKQVGMKAALVTSPLRKRRRRNGNADIIFSDYRQLRDYVLR